MFVKQIIVCALLIVSFSTLGECIKCYECDSVTSPHCKDGEFDAKKLTPVDCSKVVKPPPFATVNSTECSKIIKKVDNKLITSRGCFFTTPTNSKDSCMKPLDGNKTQDYITCAKCDTDVCNSSSNMYASFSVLVFFTLSYFAI